MSLLQRVVAYGVALSISAVCVACGGEPPLPMVGGIPVRPEDAFRAKPPPRGVPPPFVVPRHEAFALSNGMRVVFVRRAELPVVTIRLVIGRGGADAPPGHGAFYGEMLRKGTARRSALDIATTLDDLGAIHDIGTSYDATIVAVKTLTPRLDEALDLVRDIALEPAFPADEIERVRRRRLAALRFASERPTALLDAYTRRTVYPAASPYAKTLLGSEADLRAIGQADLVRLSRDWNRPENMTLFVVGDTTAAALGDRLETRFGRWRADPAPGAQRAPAPAEPEGAPRVVLVDQPGASQAHVAVVTLAVARESPDYPGLTVLGGTLSGRIFTNLRHEHGYTYDSTVEFDPYRGGGHFTAGGPITKAHTAAGVREILAEIARVRNEPLGASTIVRAQERIVLWLPGEFETGADIAEALGGLTELGVPLDGYTTFALGVTATTPEHLRRLAARYLAPGRLRVVAVGDAAAIREGLAALQLGPFEEHALATTR